MQLYYLYILLLLGLSTLTTQAQHPYAWDLTVEDGLPSLEVFDLYQDSKGYMWIGTDKGLCRYNGNKFFYYQNKEELSEAFSGIQEDPEGRIWVRNFKDQIFYVEDDSLHYFEMPSSISLQDFLVDSKGVVWLIDKARDSLYCYENNGTWKRWEAYHNDSSLLSKKGLLSIVEGIDQVIYFTSRSGLFKCVDGKVDFITNKNLARYAANPKKLIPVYLFKDKENTLFLLQNEPKNKYQISQLVDNKIGIVWNSFREVFYKTINNALRVDEHNTIWQLTLDAGLGPIFNSSATSKLDPTLLLFPDEGISDFVIDREGNYWISSLLKGVHIVPNLDIQQYTSSNSDLKYDRFGLIEKKDDERLFISTDHGEVHIYNTTKNIIEQTITAPKRECRQLYWNKERLLINGMMYQELHIPTSKPSKKYEYVSLTSSVRNSVVYKKCLLNMSSTGASFVSLTKEIGLKKLPKELFPYAITETGEVYDSEKKSKRITEVSSFYGISDELNDRVLIARDDSLMCYPEKTFPFPILDAEREAIRGIYMERGPKGLIWICTVNSGIYALNKELKAIKHFTIQDGLINNKIKKIKIDGANLWLLSAQGIQRFNPETKESRLYTKEDGLPTHEIKDIAIVNNKIWLSTAKGLVSFDKNLRSKNTIPPSIYLKRIAIHDKDTIVVPSYELSYQQNSLTIYVEGISYRSRGNFQYQYRMLGIDSSWISQSSATNVMRFPQLNPGIYTFQVKAMNEDGVESNETIDVKFVIDKPYWQVWWVQALFFLSAALIIIVAVLTRVRNKQREEQQENAMNVLRMQALQSQMNPHFIFNVLTAVQNLWLQHKNELAMELQSSFAKLLRKIFQYSSKKVISMDQIEDFLNNYLNLEQIRFEHQVQIDFEIEEDLFDTYFIPPLLIQPIIENSFKHGLFHKPTDKKLSISLKKEGDYVYCCVEDNGVGRPAKLNVEKAKRSSGLTTTEKRLFILQHDVLREPHPCSNLKITDLKGPNEAPLGTRVELWIPFVKKNE